MFILQDIVDGEYISDVIPEANDISWIDDISKAKIFSDTDNDEIKYLKKWDYKLIKLDFI